MSRGDPASSMAQFVPTATSTRCGGYRGTSVSDTSQDQGWWLASDGEWYAPETHPDRLVPRSGLTSRPVPDADGDWPEPNNGASYPPEVHQHGTPAPSRPTSRPVPDADESCWQASNGETGPSVDSVGASVYPVDSPTHDAALSPQGAWSQEPSVGDTHDFYDGCGPVPAHRHVNGGGWVANSATVSRTAFVGPASAVFESSRVLGRATVADQAQVRGQSEVSGHARICGNAVIDGEARVTDEAEVSDHAFISGWAAVSHEARVGGHTQLTDGEVTEGSSQLGEAPDSQLVSCDNGHPISATLNFCPVCGVPIAPEPDTT